MIDGESIMKNIKFSVKGLFDRLTVFDKRYSQWSSDFVRWFLADVAYTLLPIAVIASIKAITYSKGNYLYLSPEWSFATIVSFGAAITGMIELKTEIQQDFSHRVYTVTRFLVLLLIMSVIVLSLVILREDGLNINSSILWIIQLTLLFLGLMFLYVAHTAKKQQVEWESKLPSDMGRGRYYKILHKRINRIQDDLLYLRYSLRKHTEINFSTELPIQETQFWECVRRGKLLQELRQVEESIKEIHNLADELLNTSIPDLATNVDSTKTLTEEPLSSGENA